MKAYLTYPTSIEGISVIDADNVFEGGYRCKDFTVFGLHDVVHTDWGKAVEAAERNRLALMAELSSKLAALANRAPFTAPCAVTQDQR